MISNPETLFVWVWLPGETDPVVCGRLDLMGASTQFTYGRSYRNRPDAMALFDRELPITAGAQSAADPASGVPLVIADALPDAWGRRVIHHREASSGTEYSDLGYLLAGGPNRIGALGFSTNPEDQPASSSDHASLTDLQRASALIEQGEPIPPDLRAALQHGTSIGGARPKALLVDNHRQLIAKFASSADPFPIVQSEYVSMELARRSGIDVAKVELANVSRRPCLLVERFDRSPAGDRRHLVSALTILGLAAYPSGRYATYVALADEMRRSFTDPDATLRELFTRIAFNILVGNTDDHGKNHAAFVHPDGATLTLTPAFDVCPQVRTGSEAALAMAYGSDGCRVAQLAPLVAAADVYHLDRQEATALVERIVATIGEHWEEVCDSAELTSAQRNALWGTQFMNPFTFGH